MTFDELDTSITAVYSNQTVGDRIRLVFRSNIREPVKITLDEYGDIVSEEPRYIPEIADGWEVAEPLKATDIVRDDSVYQDPSNSTIHLV